MSTPLRGVLTAAERALAEAGVATPRVDAELLAAHVLGIERTKLPMVSAVEVPVADAIGRLVARRARRVPLQHLTGEVVMGAVALLVGPGVFVPRPETELLFAWALTALRGVSDPVVVDLCTGSGALGLALANARPDAVVHAVEIDEAALAWARRNAADRAAAGDTPIRLYLGDVADLDLLAALDRQVDLVVCNPPYVPLGTPVPPEVGQHDPDRAVFAGADGLAVIRPAARRAARLLRPGGWVAIEHDDTHGETVPALLAGLGMFGAVEDHPDLTGRPRFTTGRLV